MGTSRKVTCATSSSTLGSKNQSEQPIVTIKPTSLIKGGIGLKLVPFPLLVVTIVVHVGYC